MVFHQLPTHTQVEYTQLEERAALMGKQLQIEAVMQTEATLEVIIRITDDLKSSAVS